MIYVLVALAYLGGSAVLVAAAVAFDSLRNLWEYPRRRRLALAFGLWVLAAWMLAAGTLLLGSALTG